MKASEVVRVEKTESRYGKYHRWKHEMWKQEIETRINETKKERTWKYA